VHGWPAPAESNPSPPTGRDRTEGQPPPAGSARGAYGAGVTKVEGGPIRVVIVDDTEDIRVLLTLALELAGGFAVVGEAADGAVAVEEARRHQPDLMILDLAMPVLDGLEALPRIRAEAPDTTVVVLSGFGADSLGDDAVRLGAAAYVQKGINPTVLAEQLRSLVRQRRSSLADPGMG
jgi:DNA-binding NarL/FixJ family response regulator